MRLVLVTACCAAALVVAACGDDGEDRSEGRYCTEVGNRLADLNTPTLGTDDDVARTLDSWRVVAGAAPLAIEQEWATVLESVETAATVDPADPASVQRVAEVARASEPAATRVITYTYQLCGAVIGGVTPVTTTPAQVPPSTEASG